jgi:hypothetical protein
MKNKRMYPAKKPYYHQRHIPNRSNVARPHHYGGNSRPLFQGNLASGMNFGNRGHELSGYVKREIYAKDSHGNVQLARETQFYNSARRIGRVRVHDDEIDS